MERTIQVVLITQRAVLVEVVHHIMVTHKLRVVQQKLAIKEKVVEQQIFTLLLMLEDLALLNLKECCKVDLRLMQLNQLCQKTLEVHTG